MNSIFEQATFSADRIPKWPCPSCEDGWLAKIEEKFNFEMNSASKINIREDWCDPDQVELVFMCMLGCKNCEETVVMTGTGNVWEAHDENAPSQYYETYTPSFFQPPLNIISFPNDEKVPDFVRASLEKSFPLFWCDFDACASRIRATLELLLDAIGIPRKVDEKVFRELSLHDRIEKIQAEPGSEKEEVKHMIMALKWMGNAGTHELEGVQRQQLIHAYKMIEICLARLYPTVDPEIKKMVAIARDINEKKKKTRL
jgi:hypothetical protein